CGFVRSNFAFAIGRAPYSWKGHHSPEVNIGRRLAARPRKIKRQLDGGVTAWGFFDGATFSGPSGRNQSGFSRIHSSTFSAVLKARRSICTSFDWVRPEPTMVAPSTPSQTVSCCGSELILPVV